MLKLLPEFVRHSVQPQHWLGICAAFVLASPLSAQIRQGGGADASRFYVDGAIVVILVGAAVFVVARSSRRY